MSGGRRPSWPAQVAVQAALVVATAATLYPVLWVVRMALTAAQGFSLTLDPFPEAPTWANFRDVASSTDAQGRWLFGRQLFNSVAVSAATTAVGVALACTSGYAFSRFRFPGRDLGLGAFLVSQMFPGVLTAIPLYVLLDRLGLLDSLVGLTLVYSITAIPFCVFMLKGYFDTIPRELEEAAMMDGASRLAVFTRIALPLARPGIAVTALFCFMTAWNEFILAATFMGDEASMTLPVALQRYVGDYSVEWGRFAAGAVIVSLPVMALFYALQRHLVEGLTAGGVKG